MPFPLSAFETHIDKGILQKGKSYWKQGHVEDLSLTKGGQIKATVYGTDEYRVKIRVEEDQVTEQFCSCPYDWGPVCKHVAAVLYEMEASQKATPAKSTSRKKRKPKSASPAQQLDQILKALSPEEMADLVQELCETHRDLRAVIIARHAHLLKEITKNTYTKMLRSAAKSAAGRGGFIEYGAERTLTDPAENLLEHAEKHLKTGSLAQAMSICQAIIEELVDAISQADDSNGNIGYVIEQAFQLLGKIVEAELPSGFQEAFFSYCLKQSREKKYAGWGWKWSWYQLASKLVVNNDQDARLTHLLDWEVSRKGDSWSSNFHQEQAAKIQLTLLQRRDPEKVQKYLEAHVQFSSFRKQLLHQAYEAGTYNEVLRLASEGIEQDAKYAGLVSDWKQWMLKTYEAQGNTTAIISQAKNLFFSGQYEMQYFRMIKNHTAPEAWESTREALVAKMRDNSRWKPVAALAAVFIEEGLPSRLMALLQESPSLQNLSNYEAHLKDHFSPELLEMYKTAVYDLLGKSTGRSTYKEACQAMRKMKKLGGQAIVQEMVLNLKTTYPRRPALLDEMKAL